MSNHHLTPYLLFVVTTILLSAFQYGYHNGELNTPQSVISQCQGASNVNRLPECIPMPDADYALIVSMLTAGGLVGALSAPYFNDRYGRRRTLLATNVFLGLGSVLCTLASTAKGMMVGRFLSGIGSGLVTVVVPAYIAECVPEARRGLFGAFNQLSIVIGIMVAQIMGLVWSTLARWRYILAVGIVLAVLQASLLPLCVDSPRYLASLPGGVDKAKAALLRLRQEPAEEVEEEIATWKRDWANGVEESEEAVLLQEDPRTEEEEGYQKVTSWEFLTSARYRRPLFILLVLQLSQQLSGVNAVIFYSTSIMSTVFPESSGLITVSISIVNLVMTTLSAVLMDRAGRRTLFLTSSGLMTLMGTLLGWSIGAGHDRTSAFAIIGFIASFAIGLGPIPFLMIPEVVETKAVSSACSVGLSVNMISNFIISAGFLSLRNLLGQAHVFYLFSLTLLLLTVIAVFILPETKGRSAEDVVRSGYSIYPCSYERIHSTAQ
ncbi:hypothetical protein G6F46_002468 [Rhizopus delemar]|nr:hypothetical protein G6F55_001289 [Rhizopus delemar]KAG1552974.1 hypothetical protein G6F51_000881 [Rhizopus arrhizus]KAG1503140.1 hypothetical protein G6F54_001877 [Rhizopus delemar]KAG1516575.1 hypothetical protein G6F53_002048 [Rhizopus delemar]KAG1528307.1 hypothetical protein G6F52_000759 [Rhizopus delemar]